MKPLKVERYAWYLRVLPLLALALGVFEAAGVVWNAWDTGVRHRAGDPDYQGVLLVPHLFVWGAVCPLAVWLFGMLLRSSRFLVYVIRISETGIEATDPILRRRWSVRFDQVREVRWFYTGCPPQAKADVGRLLVTDAGDAVAVCDALPSWPEVLRRCAHARVHEPPQDHVERLRNLLSRRLL